MILWRPVGLVEMALVFESGMRAFPPRLAQQPIFYPVLMREYAEAIARDWNTKEEPYAGYVLRMELEDRYAAKFPPQIAGRAIHRELWVPAEELVEFNSKLSGMIAIERAFFGPKFTGYAPEEVGFRGCDAFSQIASMIATMELSMFDFRMEVSANAPALFLNFPFWKAAGEVIGVIRVDVDSGTAIFRRVAIREDVQRCGHGRIMLSLAEAFARSRNCNLIRSFVNPGACGFYERCGFSHDASTEGDLNHVPMGKSLV